MTIETYEEKRRELVEANANLTGIVLRENEKKLDIILKELKDKLSESFGGSIPYDMPFLTDRRLKENGLYAFLSRMPKGADLHVHDMALLPAEELLELLISLSGFYINGDRKSYDLSKTERDGYLSLAEAVGTGYYTKEEIVKNWTVAGKGSSDGTFWDYFEELFSRHGALSDNPQFAASYYDRAFRYYCEKNINHVEIHIMLTEDPDLSAEYVKAVRQAYYNVKKEYPAFTVRMIGAGMKADNDKIEMTKRCFLNTAYVQETVKDESDPDNVSDFVIGFDIVNEEDANLPLHEFAPMLLLAKKQFPDLKLYIHGGESLSAGNENLIDAYLLGVSRVGHGFDLYRYPDLHSKYAKAEICLECCPVSNMALGYAKDIRNHPATEYLRTGVVLALCSDDPAYMENETLTDDFFAATVGWDLTLADLKQLALNSIMYSGLDEKRKSESLLTFGKAWNEFVNTSIC